MSSKGRLLAQAITESRVLSAALTETAETPSFPITKKYTNIDLLPSSGTIGDIAFVESTNRLYIWNGNGWYNIALINTNPSFDIGGAPASSYLLDLNDSGYVSPLTITLLATDPEGIPIQYSALLSDSAGNFVTVSQDSSIFTIIPKSVDSIGEFDGAGGVFSITFRASDGVNLATVLSEFTVDLKVEIENSRYTTLMLKTNEIDAANNNTFVDGSTNNFAITRNGNTTQGSFSPYGDRWSGYFPGGTAYLLANTGSALDVAVSQDFTVEFWFNLNARTGVTPAFFSNYSAFGAGSISLFAGHNSSSQTKYILAFNGTFPRLVSSSNIIYGQWHHMAITRESGVIKMWLNGVLENSVTDTAAINEPDDKLWLGVSGDATGTGGIVGYMSDFRWVTGTAIYTSAFTPPTEPLTAVAGTSLLTCQSNRFKDSSVNDLAIMNAGNVSVTKFSPYDQSAYDASTLGGSAYFDGTGDYLNTASSNEFIASGNGFTVEAWVYYKSITGYSFIVASSTGANSYEPYWFIGSTNTGRWRLSWGNAASIDTGVAIVLNTWNHVAISMGSNGTGVFYVNGVSIATTTGKTLNGSATGVAISHGGGNIAGLYLLTGYISNIRYVKNNSVYTSNFTPLTEPLAASANTSLLCNFTNAGIFDASTKNVLETVGNTQVDTAVTKFGTVSMYFDGTGDYLTTSATPTVLLPGTTDTTFECWVQTTSSGDMAIFSNFSPSSPFNGVEFGVNNGYQTFWSQGTFINRPTGTTGVSTLKDGGWHHLVWVITNSGTSLSTYVDGVLNYAASITPSTTGKSTQSIGSDSNTTRGRYFNGYIEDLRITKGLARYTSNFTPPSAPLQG